MVDTYQIGETVFHRVFGKGTVKNLENHGAAHRIIVEFSGGVKTLDLSIAQAILFSSNPNAELAEEAKITKEPYPYPAFQSKTSFPLSTQKPLKKISVEGEVEIETAESVPVEKKCKCGKRAGHKGRCPGWKLSKESKALSSPVTIVPSPNGIKEEISNLIKIRQDKIQQLQIELAALLAVSDML